MSEVTRILAAIERGDVRAVDELFPLVYQELRQLYFKELFICNGLSINNRGTNALADLFEMRQRALTVFEVF